jgi:hypothetical protein
VVHTTALYLWAKEENISKDNYIGLPRQQPEVSVMFINVLTEEKRTWNLDFLIDSTCITIHNHNL